ncbi:protein suppressor of white apricot [Planococcus citri]|uniref:protein suppressor of white apricot n=1 Tax=Planococcus citri TaxID=170843 RepID=UPI0031F7A4B3
MDNFRSIHGQDYGILRKQDSKDEELFVFGYSCKVYEDYDKSLYVDQGKHLIPWLGDESLKIDRYDCRGALNDLTKYLPKSESFDLRANLSNQEKRIEQLCDEERYRALTTNEEEETLFQEEELKRLQQALNNEKSYSEVGFSYENDNKSPTESVSKEITAEEETFIPPYQLDVPVGMKIPKTKKHHEIIERTAFFINDQGPQMEILLKIKQAGNIQFNFLSFDNELHPYYRHLLMAVKNEKYKPTSAPPAEKESINEDTYLHPSLVQASQPVTQSEPAPKIPTIAYKPSADCTYSALVNRIKETQTSSLLESIKKNYGANSQNYSEQNEISAKIDGTAGSTSALPLSALTKSARRRRIRKEKHKAAAASFKIYYAEEVKNPDEADESDEEDLSEEKNEDTLEDKQDELPVGALKPVPAPAPVVELPPLDMQLIIDKMASYVAKNGRDFESVVQNKGDSRFSFLNKDHVFNPYYQQKVQLYLQLENPNLSPALIEKVSYDRTAGNTLHKSGIHQNAMKSSIKMNKLLKLKQPTPICFSIKKPKDQETLEIKSALPYEESEGEEETENEDSIGENVEEKTEEKVEKNAESEVIENSSVDQLILENTKKPPDITLEKWARERLQAKLVTAVKEKLAAKAVREKDKQLQAERRKKAAEFINLLQKDNLVNKTQASETIGDFSSSSAKNEASDVISIPSGSSPSDSDSVVSVPFSDEDDKQKRAKRKPDESSNDLHEKTKKRLISSVNNKNTYSRSRHRDEEPNHRHSSVHSKHSHGYRKYDRERKPYSKKKKHRHSRNDISSSSSSKKSYKSHHKKKRSRYSSEISESSSSSSSYSSDNDSRK